VQRLGWLWPYAALLFALVRLSRAAPTDQRGCHPRIPECGHKPLDYKHHIFFCLNQRDNGQSCCAEQGASDAFEHCKAQVKAKGLAGPGVCG
jgi:hypothetical protein